MCRLLFNFKSPLQFYSLGNKFVNKNKFQKGKFPNAPGKFQKPATGKSDKPDAQAKPEKVDWNKFKQEKKELKIKRKSTKTGIDKINEAKKLYEQLKW